MVLCDIGFVHYAMKSSRTKLRKQQKQQDVTHARPASPPEMRLINAILIAVVAVTPLAMITGVFLSSDVIPKIFLILMGAALLVVFQQRWSSGLRILWNATAGRPFLLLLAAQLISLVISTLFSKQFSLSVAGTLWRRFGLVEQAATLVIATGVACTVALRPVWSTSLLRAVSICGGLAAFYGILQYFNIDPFLDRKLYSIEYLGGVLRPPATMGHALYFSAYLVPVVFIAGASALSETSKAWRPIHVAVVILSCAAIVLSGTRSAALATAAGGILFGWRRLRHGERGFSLKHAVAPALFLAGTAMFVLSPAGANLRNRMLQWKTETGGPRLEMWRESPALIGQRPLIGLGPETFANEFRRIESVELSRTYPDFYNETPHNAFIDAACAQGIPGCLILLGVFLLGCFACRSNAAGSNSVQAGLEAALLGLLVCSMFASLTLVTLLYLWSTAGLAVALARSGVQSKSALRLGFPRLVAVPLAGIFFFAAVSLAAQDAAWASIGSAVDRRNFADASEAYSRATSLSAGMPGYELWASREMASLGRSLGNTPDGASCWIKAADAAALAETRSEERFNATYQSSVLAVAAGNLALAALKARETIQLAPNWYKGHLLLSQILAAVGDNQQAEHEAEASALLGWKR